jgi:PleD family two-component response regulator
MLKELLQQRQEYEAQAQALQEQINAVNVDIEHVLAEQLAAVRKLQAKEFGAVNLVAEGYKVTETVPKKVEWDQTKMNDLFDAIAAAGDDPRAYMKIKLEVSEKAYAEFVPAVQTMFADCRTVKPGRPVLKFEEVTNA